MLRTIVLGLAFALALTACSPGAAPVLATGHQHDPSERCIGVD